MTIHAPSERARRALERIEEAQTRSLAHLNQDGPERAFLVELLETSCLLELAKIDPASMDTVQYLQMCVDVLAQLSPVSGCSATTIDGAGRSVSVQSGVMPMLGGRFPFVVGESVLGALVTGTATDSFGPDDRFFEKAAELIAQGIRAAIESERLRRDAATATASRLASEMHDDVGQRLQELVHAVASFPGVVGAELVVDHAAIFPPVVVQAGYWDDDSRPHAVQTVTLELAQVGHLVGRLRSLDNGEVDEEPLHAVLASLAGSLDRLADTQRLREEAETEPLTGLGNRRRLERVLNVAITRAGWFGEKVAVLIVDIDRLKEVNDALGHDVGDDVIVASADSLRERVREYDECARLGGDEFVVVAPVPDVLEALRLADALRLGVRTRASDVLPDGWNVSATIGIALFPDSGDDPETLLRAADAALYRAKRDGRDGVAVSEPVEALPQPATRRRFLRRS